MAKTKTAEMFDDGKRISISLDNGDFLVYHLNYEEIDKIDILETPFKNKNKAIFMYNENQKFNNNYNNSNAFSLYNENKSFNNTQRNN